jgi:REP element-mobilizing transposase RayT
VALAAGGVEDHVHMLVGLRPAMAVSDLVRDLKVATSPFIARELKLDGFAWQTGYGVFSLRDVGLEIVRRYVCNQPAHHADGSTIAEWEQCSRQPRAAG